MQLGEAIAIGLLAAEMELRCPFSEPQPQKGASEVEDESPEDDDKDSNQTPEGNSGKILGQNLLAGSAGREGTVEGPFPADAYNVKSPQVDTARTGLWIWVPPANDIGGGLQGFTVAAHHLIPGNASLRDSLLKAFMTRDQKVEVLTAKGAKQKSIRQHIGYNVNGSHNGVWLPGNYFIRAHCQPFQGVKWSNSPKKGISWGALESDDWQLNYVAACAKVAGGQFHDSHDGYSKEVLKWLNKIASILSIHECDQCQHAEIDAPFFIKERLYKMSKYLRAQLQGPPQGWRQPWFTSDRWKAEAFSNGRVSTAFLAAHTASHGVATPSTVN
jgi:hypothetical protein